MKCRCGSQGKKNYIKSKHIHVKLRQNQIIGGLSKCAIIPFTKIVLFYKKLLGATKTVH